MVMICCVVGDDVPRATPNGRCFLTGSAKHLRYTTLHLQLQQFNGFPCLATEPLLRSPMIPAAPRGARLHENMRTAVLFGRLCLHRGGSPTQLLSRFAPPSRLRFARPPSWPRRQFSGGSYSGYSKRAPVARTVLLAALTPGAFLELAEEGDSSDKTGELHMLEASRAEVRTGVSKDARGLKRLRQQLFVLWYCYIYDPIATGFRFVHLVFIFMPVILTFPVAWFGNRLEDRGGERAGTVWWFQFLVRAMERAGPAFIKVGCLFWNLYECAY